MGIVTTYELNKQAYCVVVPETVPWITPESRLSLLNGRTVNENITSYRSLNYPGAVLRNTGHQYGREEHLFDYWTNRPLRRETVETTWFRLAAQSGCPGNQIGTGFRATVSADTVEFLEWIAVYFYVDGERGTSHQISVFGGTVSIVT